MIRQAKATYEDLSFIMSKIDTMEVTALNSDRLTEQGREFLKAMLDSVRTEVKTEMFYSLMGFMLDCGRLKAVKEDENGEADTGREDS